AGCRELSRTSCRRPESSNGIHSAPRPSARPSTVRRPGRIPLREAKTSAVFCAAWRLLLAMNRMAKLYREGSEGCGVFSVLQTQFVAQPARLPARHLDGRSAFERDQQAAVDVGLDVFDRMQVDDAA